MKRKKCIGCGKWKAISKFYTGRNKCKECLKAYQAEWARRNPEKVKLYRKRHRPKQRAYYRRWYAEKGRKRKADYLAVIHSWMDAHPEAIRARQVLQNAIRTGKLQRPKKCSRCGRTDTKIHCHHPDYHKPLRIIGLCASCHKIIHNGEKKS